MSKVVKMSQSKFIIYSMAFILVGAIVTGMPLLIQSKSYYDYAQTLKSNLISKQQQLSG